MLCHSDCSQILCNINIIVHILTGSDYFVNLQDIASRNFTVTFLSKQANSSEHVIQIVDDNTSEGKEYFRLRITAVRPIGQAAQFFIPEPGVNETFVDITIEDNKSKSGSSFFATHYKIESELTLYNKYASSHYYQFP